MDGKIKKNVSMSKVMIVEGKRIKQKKIPKRQKSYLKFKPISLQSRESSIDSLLLKWEGVYKLEISEGFQRTLDLVPGRDVNAEFPWKVISKSKLIDILDWNENYSEFYCIGPQIRSYEDEDILIGWAPTSHHTTDIFYIILNKDTRELIENMNTQYYDKLKKSIVDLKFRSVRPWKSLGSEAEVEELSVTALRKLFLVELKSEFPFHKNTIFKLRQVGDCPDGYVELLTDPRKSYEVIDKKRVDIQTQMGEERVSTNTQTTYVYPQNKICQFPDEDFIPFEREIKELMEKIKKGRIVIKFEEKVITQMEEGLRTNFDFNIFEDDYGDLRELAKKYWFFNRKRDMIDLKLSLTFLEVQTTKTAVVRDGTWNSFRSGMLALCYSDFATTSIGHYPVFPQQTDVIEGPVPILLWRYHDPLKPQLYFETTREVTSLSFCPYKENILIAGCSSGQILVWDMQDHLYQEPPPPLTYRQKLRREYICEKCHWYKKFLDSHIKPSYISKLKHSHHANVTSLKWIHPYLKLSSLGKWEMRKNEKTLNRLMFMSLSSDGTILFWDILLKLPEDIPKKVMVLPEAIQKVRLHRMNAYIKPIYKVLVNVNRHPVPIAATIRVGTQFNYIPVHPVSSNFNVDCEYFLDTIPEPHELDYDKPFFITSLQGQIYKIKWGNKPTEKWKKTVEAEVDKVTSIHDGPVTSCRIHPNFEEYLITVGGTIFAIWHEDSHHPLLWRKAPNGIKYFAATFAVDQPSYIRAMRSDGKLEYWDLLKNLTEPIKYVNIGGDLSTNLISSISKHHARKSTIAISDSLGSCSIYYFPPYIRENTCMYFQKCRELFLDLKMHKTHYWGWLRQFEETQMNYTMNLLSSIHSASRSFKSKLSRKSSTSQIENQSEMQKLHSIFLDLTRDARSRQMYEALLKRKGLTIDDFKPNKLTRTQDEDSKKIAQKMKESYKLKEKALAYVYHDISKEQDYIRTTLSESSSSVIRLEDGFHYIADYGRIEALMLDFIDSSPFNYEPKFHKLLHRQRKNSFKNIFRLSLLQKRIGNVIQKLDIRTESEKRKVKFF